MFSRRAFQRIAAYVLVTVLFAVAWPVMSHAFVGNATATAVPGICSLDGWKAAVTPLPAIPQPGTVAPKPCVFCTSSVPLLAEAHGLRIVVSLNGTTPTAQLPQHEALPPDRAATQPLRPRAPPAAM